MEMKDLRRRSTTAAVLALVIVVLFSLAYWFCLGKIILSFSLLLAAFYCALESARLLCVIGSSKIKYWAVLFSIPVIVVFLWGVGNFGLCNIEWRPARGVAIVALSTLVATSVSVILIFYRESTDLVKIQKNLLMVILICFLVGMGGGSIVGLAGTHNGVLSIAWLLIVVCLNDILAYLGGSLLKGPKLCPAISPGKTVSGSICGMLGGSIVAAAFYFWLPYSTVYTAAIVGLAITVVAQISDLLESLLKRMAGVKDSGSFLPGHGGLLDRADALLGAAVVLYAWIFLNSWL